MAEAALKRPCVRPEVPAAESLIRSLLTHVEAQSGSLPGGAEEILLDLEVDGARYLLIRMPKAVPGRIHLSPREQEIVRMVAQGHSNKIIADVLSISSWTVCTHLRRIFAKLGVCSRAAMIAKFIENGAARDLRSGTIGYSPDPSDAGVQEYT